ncbi:Retrovirus-related Pol polyprotein from transposon TNT 1-94 [Melia azedarach]|uniref:Retrovirus-related Pol polyprotein from transposon TNT 1-94 n=1 Tax=Melia azedarach TaxID=155640 RepID=A0ACC1X0P9_MELAZ|nr:Retrovirus-related Pol polyprotein from transposon TNT 1-94 [Melia azedarach]
MSGMNVKIDKFAGRNSFSLWQIKMRALLKQQGLWVPLTRKPADPITTEIAVLEEKAHSTIMLCLVDDIITEVAEEETAQGLWVKLESLYMTKSLTNKLLLKQRLFSLRMQEGMPLRDHLDQLNTILLELRNIDVKVEDEDAALILFVSLPLSYENFVQSFIIRKDTVSLEEVRSSLHTRELRHKATGTGADNQAARLVASGSYSHGNSGKKKFKKPVSKGPKPNNVYNYCTAAVANTNSKEDIVLVADEHTHHNDVWILDSGASYHICPRREWFTTYEQVNGGNTSMANSSVCKAVGIGSVKIRKHDGKFCTLNDVRHVPLMTKNLISLSILDNKGFSFQGEGGVLHVCKGSNVVLKGVKRGTLYFLQGSMPSSSVAVASSEIDKDNMTKLWHMRLGHMSARGMQIMSKGDILCGYKVKDLEFCEHCIFGMLHRSKFPKHKSEAFKNFRQWKALVENQTGKNIKRLQTDNGLEFCWSEFDEFYQHPQSESEPSSSSLPVASQHSLALNQSKRANYGIPPKRYGFEDMVAYALQVAEEVDLDSNEPSTYKEAVTCTESTQWLAVMGDEMESLHKNQTWELTKRPRDRKIVTCKWVYKEKEGEISVEGIKYKARVVARGFTQKEGVHYNEIFSPVVKHTSIRVLLAIVAHQNLELEQLDVKTAFLHGELEEEIYMTQPDGFQVPDDMLIAAENKSDVQKLKDLLNVEFEMKDLGAARKILGMEIYRDRSKKKLFLSHKGYIQKILSRFGMFTTKPIDTPSAANAHLSVAFAPKSVEEKEYMSRVPYASAVGSLMYAMVCTRPDLAQSISVVSTFDVGLIYGGDTQCLVTRFSDSDYAGDVNSRRSMTGYVFTLGSSVVSWKATLQPTVTFSTTEVEYMALTEATKEGIWLKGLVSDLGLHHDQAIMYCDNLSAICLAKDQVHHERTKHIDVRYHFLRSEKRIKVNKVGTADNPVDMFTKPVPHSKFRIASSNIVWTC